MERDLSRHRIAEDLEDRAARETAVAVEEEEVVTDSTEAVEVPVMLEVAEMEMDTGTAAVVAAEHLAAVSKTIN